MEIKLDPLFHQCGWRIDALCGMMGVTPRTFNRLVDDSLGKTGRDWLREFRVVVACHLLLAGGKVETVAVRLGFSNNSNFTRDFRKLIGVPPSEFLRLERLRAERYLSGK